MNDETKGASGTADAFDQAAEFSPSTTVALTSKNWQVAARFIRLGVHLETMREEARVAGKGGAVEVLIATIAEGSSHG